MRERQRRVDFTNSWMFGRVMTDESICRDVIRAVLGIEAVRIDYLNAEQVLDPAPESHGVRMDVYARERGSGERVYDLEMQAQREPLLGKRFQYYQAVLDVRELPAGDDYDRLPESFVVFLCSQDPFGYDLPVYHLERRCDEVPELRLGNASHWLALNARAWEDAPGGDLLDLLRYAQTGKALGSLSRKIEEAVGRANEDREWVDKVWSVSTIVENAARRERINGRIACEEAREEGRQEGLEEEPRGSPPWRPGSSRPAASTISRKRHPIPSGETSSFGSSICRAVVPLRRLGPWCRRRSSPPNLTFLSVG